MAAEDGDTVVLIEGGSELVIAEKDLTSRGLIALIDPTMPLPS